MPKNLKRITRGLGLIAAAATVVMLSACASPSSTQPERSAGLFSKGVRVCVTNDQPKPVRVAWLTSDTHDSQKTLSTGQTACGEGTSNFYLFDVGLMLEWRDGQTQTFYAGNGMIGYPQVAVDEDLKTAADACGFEGASGPNDSDLGFAVPCSDGYATGEERFYPSGNKSANGQKPHLVSVTRGDDTAWKEFRLSVQK